MDLGTGYIKNLTDTTVSNVKFDNFKNNASNVGKNSDIHAKDIETAAQEFEELFVGQLLKMMFDTVEVDSLFGGGYAEETYRGLLVDEYGKAIGQSGGIGISDSVQRTLMQMQGL